MRRNTVNANLGHKMSFGNVKSYKISELMCSDGPMSEKLEPENMGHN